MDNAPKLTIRGPNNDDWASLYAVLSVPALLVNTIELPYAHEEAFRERMSQAQSNRHVLIAETALPSGRKRVIGAAYLTVQAGRRRHVGELQLLLHPDVQYGESSREVLAAALDLADNWLGLRRIQTIVFADDRAAVEFYEAAGFQCEATLRRYAQRAGRLSDALMLSRVVSALPAQGESR